MAELPEFDDGLVTVSHPVTGATRRVSRDRADSLSDLGWQTTLPTPRRGVPVEQPDVEAGKAQLAAATGEKPEELHLATTVKRAAKKAAKRHDAGAEAATAEASTASSESAEAPVPASENAATLLHREAEAGHGGLQVDKGASDA